MSAIYANLEAVQVVAIFGTSHDLLTGRGKQFELIDVFDKDCLSINLNQTHINQIMKNPR